MRINLNPGLNLKSYYKPAVKATAEQLAEAGRVIWTCTQRGKKVPEKYMSGQSFVEWASKTKGKVFKKGWFGKYKLTSEGKKWVEHSLANVGLEDNAPLCRLISATIRKLNGLK